MSLITLTTDYGDSDGFVGVIKGVIYNISPETDIIDLAHSIPAGDILHAAYVLRNAYRYYPANTIHIAVVDPGVGGKRKALALHALDQYFVVPDNGIISWIVRDMEAAGEEMNAWSLKDERFRLSPTSTTFHGRDIFAPAAAFLARGVDPSELGPELHAAMEPEGELSGGPVIDLLRSLGDHDDDEGCIIHIDRFGNCITSIEGDMVGSESEGHVEIETVDGQVKVPGLAPSYGSVLVGEAVAIMGSNGLVEIAINGGNAAERLGIHRGNRVRLTIQ